VKTLFQSWCEANDKPALPEHYIQQENPYLQVLKLSEVRAVTFEQRQSRRVRTWYENHPECRHELLPLDWRGQQFRANKPSIDTGSRVGRGWFDKATSVRVSIDSQTLEIREEDRPEHRLSQTDSLDKSMALAAAMSSPAYKREIKDYEKQLERWRKLSEKQIRELLQRKRQGETVKDLASAYGVTGRTIFNYNKAYSEN
jgi:hypothetical protein